MATQEQTRSRIIEVSSVPWQEIQPGIRMKQLWMDETTKRRAVMARIEPGGQAPLRHRHIGDELVFVIEGALTDEFGTVTAGNMGYRPDGCVHTVSSTHGATVLAVITGEIAPHSETGSAPPSQIFTLKDLPWNDALPGVRQKRIWEDAATKRRAVMARFEPGASLPLHKHVGDELIFILEGSNADESGEVITGNMSYRPNGCVHTVTTKHGATALGFVWGHTEPA